MEWEVNQKDLAAALSITARQVRNLKNQGLFECTKNTKKYNLPRCISEYIDFKIKGEIGNGTNVIKEKEQAEHESLKKEITKIKLRKLRKEVHEAADVETFLNNMLLDFRNRLLAIPAKTAPQILGEQDINVIINLLTSEMLETIDELSEYNPDAVNGGLSEADFDIDEDEEND